MLTPTPYHGTPLPNISVRPFFSFVVLRRVKTKSNQNNTLPDRRNDQRKSRSDPLINKSAGKTSRKQRQQEPRPPIPPPVPPRQQPRVDQQIHPGRRRHRRRDLRHLGRACHGHLRARRERQERDDAHRRRTLGLDDAPAAILQRRGRENERRLDGIAHEQPQAASAADRVADLAHDQGAGDEQAEADADVGQGEERAGDPGRPDGHQDRVARLVGGEAVVVREGGGVLHAGGEGEEEEFGFDEDVDADGGGEVGDDLLDRRPSSLHLCDFLYIFHTAE